MRLPLNADIRTVDIRTVQALIPRLRARDVPSIVPRTIVREVECDGEPPVEAVRNCSIC